MTGRPAGWTLHPGHTYVPAPGRLRWAFARLRGNRNMVDYAIRVQQKRAGRPPGIRGGARHLADDAAVWLTGQVKWGPPRRISMIGWAAWWVVVVFFEPGVRLAKARSAAVADAYDWFSAALWAAIGVILLAAAVTFAAAVIRRRR